MTWKRRIRYNHFVAMSVMACNLAFFCYIFSWQFKQQHRETKRGANPVFRGGTKPHLVRTFQVMDTQNMTWLSSKVLKLLWTVHIHCAIFCITTTSLVVKICAKSIAYSLSIPPDADFSLPIWYLAPHKFYLFVPSLPVLCRQRPEVTEIENHTLRACVQCFFVLNLTI